MEPVAQAQGSYRLGRPGDSSMGTGNTTVQLRTPPPQQNLGLGQSIRNSFQNDIPAAAPRLSGMAGTSQFMGGAAQRLFGSPPPLRGSAQQMDAQESSFSGFAAPTVAQLRQLGDRDVVIVVDKSRSMATPDCPAGAPSTIRNIFMSVAGFGGGFSGAIPRWEWCRRQTMHVASLMSRIPGSSLKLVLFDSNSTEFENVNLNSIGDIFNRYQPSGGTNATAAIKKQVNNYFERKKYARVRPMLIVCITDGAPDNSRSLKDLIVNTSMRIDSPQDVQFTFLQVGNEAQGNHLLPELDYDLTNQGARYDIVTCRDFGSLVRSGLMKALIDSVNASGALARRW